MASTSQRIHPNKEAFIEGADHIFASWTALELAVQQQWGGPDSQEKRDWMVDVVVEEFGKKGSKIDQEDIEDLLLQIMEDEFECILEDNSASDVSYHLCKIYRECVKGDHSTVDKLRLQRDSKDNSKAAVSSSINVPGQSVSGDESSSDEEMDQD
ncbi:hypothetical protein BB559_002509 [Furculomyces boomerangus]|uniref:Pre-rRNA-processing protein TSR2 n=2 Tax=Harpellales TaxID=61421 RepID=A0A2T9YUM7_9FUNG|nr:hypothetical protein BB559_002509 [Furculomyces boomerangus]PVZ98749.1 hypothetical protein BB558_005254 [Smittium angustum]